MELGEDLSHSHGHGWQGYRATHWLPVLPEAVSMPSLGWGGGDTGEEYYGVGKTLEHYPCLLGRRVEGIGKR